MKIPAILVSMLLALSLQVTPVFAHSDKDSSDKDSHEHAYNKDKDHNDKNGAKDRGERGDGYRGAGHSDASGNPVVNDRFLPDWWPF